ncbi:hypothetical protein [Neisseria gonorrhoeae]|uniref:hypothetical protein n=1 Tax=Neisseria gonorrhoeae TaxID=485 RepID=UPI00312004F1
MSETTTTTTAQDPRTGFSLLELRRWANAQADHVDDGAVRVVVGFRGQIQKITLTTTQEA